MQYQTEQIFYPKNSFCLLLLKDRENVNCNSKKYRASHVSTSQPHYLTIPTEICSIYFNLVVQCIESVITIGSGSSICQLNLQKILFREELLYYFMLIFSPVCSFSHTEVLVENAFYFINK